MNQYKYETHAHTSYVSKCANITPKELVNFYKDRGYTGIFVTDHFLNGNTAVPQNLPWEERINHYCNGYKKALEEGDKIGLDVFFGFEYTYRGTDFLTYGLDEQWLIAHPSILNLNLNNYLDFVRKEGAFVVHAHPFREADYIDMIRLLPRKVDAIEILNGERLNFENAQAEKYANDYGLITFAGSDIHSLSPSKLCGILSPTRFKDVGDMIDAAGNNKISLF